VEFNEINILDKLFDFSLLSGGWGGLKNSCLFLSYHIRDLAHSFLYFKNGGWEEGEKYGNTSEEMA